jgi:hypothetical protein
MRAAGGARGEAESLANVLRAKHGVRGQTNRAPLSSHASLTAAIFEASGL